MRYLTKLRTFFSKIESIPEQRDERIICSVVFSDVDIVVEGCTGTVCERESQPMNFIEPINVIQTLAKAKLGAGEILLNCIDRDGTNSGYDIELINAVKNAVSIPVIASSGAGRVEHFYQVFTETAAESALAAGIFHRKEVPIHEVKEFLRGKVEIRK